MEQKLLDALAKIPPRSPEELERNVKFFLYGEFGVGKTIAFCRWCKILFEHTGKKGLVVTTDTGMDSIHNHKDLLDFVEVVPYNGLSHLDAIGQAITEGVGGYEIFGAVDLDTISQVQEEYLDWLLENFEFKGDLRDKGTPRLGTRGLKPQDITSLVDYKMARDNMRGPIKTLVKAPADVWFTAHLREPNFMEAQKGKIVRRPTLTEAVFKLVAREASLLGFMERKGKNRTIQFETNPTTVTKSRIKELDNLKVSDDDFLEILTKWKFEK